MTGLLQYKYTVKRDGMLLDCGCEFTHDGDYGRADYVDYARRGTLNLHSRYLLLWMSFGALSVSLLTQPDAGAIIKGLKFGRLPVTFSLAKLFL